MIHTILDEATTQEKAEAWDYLMRSHHDPSTAIVVAFEYLKSSVIARKSSEMLSNRQNGVVSNFRPHDCRPQSEVIHSSYN